MSQKLLDHYSVLSLLAICKPGVDFHRHLLFSCCDLSSTRTWSLCLITWSQHHFLFCL